MKTRICSAALISTFKLILCVPTVKILDIIICFWFCKF